MDRNVHEIMKSCLRIRQVKFVFQKEGWFDVSDAIDNFCNKLEARLEREGWIG